MHSHSCIWGLPLLFTRVYLTQLVHAFVSSHGVSKYQPNPFTHGSSTDVVSLNMLVCRVRLFVH